jgi:hypothetical protein
MSVFRYYDPENMVYSHCKKTMDRPPPLIPTTQPIPTPLPLTGGVLDHRSKVIWIIDLVLVGVFLTVTAWWTIVVTIGAVKNINAGDWNVLFIPLYVVVLIAGGIVLRMMWKRLRAAYVPLVVATAFMMYLAVSGLMLHTYTWSIADFFFPGLALVFISILVLYVFVPKRT